MRGLVLSLVCILWVFTLQAAPHDSTAHRLLREGNALLEAGQAGEALPLLRAAEARFRVLDSTAQAITAGLGGAYCLYLSGDFRGAAGKLDSLDREAAQARLPLLRADVNSLSAATWDALGEVDKALAAGLEAVRLYERLQPSSAPAEYHNLGAICFRRGDFGQAVEYLNGARRGFLQMGDSIEAAWTGPNLGLAHLRLYEYEAAVAVLGASVRELEAAGVPPNPEMVALYNNLALAYAELEHWAGAHDALSRAAAVPGLPHHLRAVTTGNLGYVYHAMGDAEQAAPLLRSAVDALRRAPTQNRESLAKLLLHLAMVVQELEGPQPALALVEEGIQVDQQRTAKSAPVNPQRSAGRRTLLRLLAQKARLLMALDRPQAALATYHQAYAVVDFMRQDFFGEVSRKFWAAYVLPLYEEGIRAAIAAGKESEAFVIAGRGKAAMLLEEMRGVAAQEHLVVPRAVQREERRLRLDIAFHHKLMAEAEVGGDSGAVAREKGVLFRLNRQWDGLMRALRQHFPQYHSLKYAPSQFSPQGLHAFARHNGVDILEYFVGKNHVYLLHMDAEGPRVIALPNPDSLVRAIGQLRPALSNWDGVVSGGTLGKETFARHAHGFYRDWVAPAFPKGPPARLVVIPDGPVASIPFEALLAAPATPAMGYRDLPYLIRSTEISYGWSAAVLFAQMMAHSQREHQYRGCLAFAPVYVGKTGAAPLPGALEEVEALKQKWEGKFLAGMGATEEAFKQEAAHYPILHLAMHGTLSDVIPSLSWLTFTLPGANAKEDGVLHAYELGQMHIPAEMVVLSACESGKGKDLPGEGVQSLARAFTAAGARSTVMSLWKLQDASSAKVMEHFYDGLMEGKGKGAALQSARLAYLESADDLEAHPAFWAGYVLVGDAGPLEMGGAKDGGLPWWLWTIFVGVLGMALWWIAPGLSLPRDGRAG